MGKAISIATFQFIALFPEEEILIRAGLKGRRAGFMFFM